MFYTQSNLVSDPVFPLTFLIDSWLPGMMDALFQATFLCALLLFWLCVYHGLRQVNIYYGLMRPAWYQVVLEATYCFFFQNERTLLGFYAPKLIVIVPLWLCAVVLSAWQKCDEKQDPTYNHIVDADNYYVSNWKYALFIFI